MSSKLPTTDRGSRIRWVDVAKGVGIVLVFYGHFVEHFIARGVPAAALQMRWIYSFHMPMFFLLVGLVYKDRAMSLGEFVVRQLKTRLAPVWVFNLVGMLIWIAIEAARGESGLLHQGGWFGLIRHCARESWLTFVQGRPQWNTLTWFLVCLLVIEIWQFGLKPLLQTNLRLGASILGFGTLTVLATVFADALYDTLGVRRHWWHMTSGLAAMFFYQLGILLRRVGFVRGDGANARCYVLAALCLAVTLATYNLNQPVHRNNPPVVLTINAEFGNVLWFFVTSLAGTFFIVYLSRILAGSRLLNYLGSITLALMCLDGILLDFANAPVIDWILAMRPAPGTGLLTILCVVATGLSILVCIPGMWFLERYVPVALGRPLRRPPRSEPATASTGPTS